MMMRLSLAETSKTPEGKRASSNPKRECSSSSASCASSNAWLRCASSAVRVMTWASIDSRAAACSVTSWYNTTYAKILPNSSWMGAFERRMA